jgi:hypothetical protein
MRYNENSGIRIGREDFAALEEESRNRAAWAAVHQRSRDSQQRSSRAHNDDSRRFQTVQHQRDRELFECKASADRENDQLSVREHADYERRARDERGRNSRMMILTTSRLR